MCGSACSRTVVLLFVMLSGHSPPPWAPGRGVRGGTDGQTGGLAGVSSFLGTRDVHQRAHSAPPRAVPTAHGCVDGPRQTWDEPAVTRVVRRGCMCVRRGVRPRWVVREAWCAAAWRVRVWCAETWHVKTSVRGHGVRRHDVWRHGVPTWLAEHCVCMHGVRRHCVEVLRAGV